MAQPKPKGVDDPNAAWNTSRKELPALAYGFCNILAGVFEPILHSHFGVHGQRRYVFSALLLYVFGVGSPIVLYGYLPVWVAFVAYRRMTPCWADGIDTRFSGWPWLTTLIPGVDDFYKGKAVEAVGVMAFGCWLKRFSPTLALFVFICGLGILGEVVTEMVIWRGRAISLHNARAQARNWQDLNQGA